MSVTRERHESNLLRAMTSGARQKNEVAGFSTTTGTKTQTHSCISRAEARIVRFPIATLAFWESLRPRSPSG